MSPIPKRYAVLAFAGVALLAFLASRQQQADPLMTDFANRDPVLDAHKALSHGDRRLLAGEYGWGRKVPRLSPETRAEDSALILRHGVRLIVRTSDAWSSDSELRFRVASVEYAARYDSVILAADRTRR